MWNYEISGKHALHQWFSYRKANRERPIISDRRKPSRLGEIQPDHWLAEYPTELINVLNVLGRLVDLEQLQVDLPTRPDLFLPADFNRRVEQGRRPHRRRYSTRRSTTAEPSEQASLLGWLHRFLGSLEGSLRTSYRLDSRTSRFWRLWFPALGSN
jgi:hypothetical protein